MIHELKLRREFFDYVRFGMKKFEIRKDDRGFNVGDTLVLKEIDEAGGETGRYLVRQVDYIYRGEFCLPGYCVMSISAL